MRLLMLPCSALLLLLTLGGCLANGSYSYPSYGHGYSGYGYAPYGGYAYRPHQHSYRSWSPPPHHRHHHSHHHQSRPLFPHRPIWKKW